MHDVTIEQLAIPATLDAPGGAEFIEMTRVRNEIEADTFGSGDLAYEPAELLPFWQDAYRPQLLWVARVNARIVARAVYEAPVEEGSREAWLAVEVLPEFRRRGIGGALYDELVAQARADGRHVLQAEALGSPGFTNPLASPTGFGAVDADAASTRFLQRRGFRLEQVERASRLALPAEGLPARIAQTRAAAGDDYRVETWEGRTPPHWLDDLAVVHQRMSTDAPSAGLDLTEEAWDGERVRNEDDLRERSPRRVVTAVAIHTPSGRLVGFTELSVPPELGRPVDQNDTLVLREHRGHRLGMLLKLENLDYLERMHPGHPAVITFNAEENRPMLDVNEAIGFVPVAYSGVWKLEL